MFEHEVGDAEDPSQHVALHSNPPALHSGQAARHAHPHDHFRLHTDASLQARRLARHPYRWAVVGWHQTPLPSKAPQGQWRFYSSLRQALTHLFQR